MRYADTRHGGGNRCEQNPREEEEVRPGVSTREASQAEAASEQFEAQTTLESFLSKKAQAMLDKALGAGQSIVKVTAEMDFSKTEKRNETYDAEGRVVYDETISSRSTSSPEAVGGAEGGTTTIQVGTAGKGAGQLAMNETKEEDIKTKYKVPSTVENVRVACDVHNVFAARAVLGDEWMDRWTRRGRAGERGDAPPPP